MCFLSMCCEIRKRRCSTCRVQEVPLLITGYYTISCTDSKGGCNQQLTRNLTSSPAWCFYSFSIFRQYESPSPQVWLPLSESVTVANNTLIIDQQCVSWGRKLHIVPEIPCEHPQVAQIRPTAPSSGDEGNCNNSSTSTLNRNIK